MLDNPYKGLGVAVVTPFTKDNQIDYISLKKIIDFLIDGGVDFIVSLGTTGETPTLNKDERKSIFEHTLEFVEKRVPVIANVGGNNTQEVLDDLKYYPISDFQGIMTVTPYYNKPNQRGLFQHFSAIANETDLPIILYNIPGRTGTRIEVETLIALATKHMNITAVKESTGDMNHIQQIAANKPPHFSLISGDDYMNYPIISLGGAGVISVAGNCLPSIIKTMLEAVNTKNYEKALKLHLKQINFINLLFKDGNPGGVKTVMSHIGLCENLLRLPLVKVRQEIEDKLIHEFEKIKL